MPLPASQGHTFRNRLPVVVQRGRETVVRLESRLGASKVAPSSGTYEFRSPTGTILQSGSVTIDSDVPQFTVSASSVPSTLAYGEGYTIVWGLTYDGVVTDVRQIAYLARYDLHCPITQADLEQIYPNIAGLLGSDASDLQGFIDDAWSDSVRSLANDGRWVAQIVDADSLAELVKHKALAAFFRYSTVVAQNEGHRFAYEEHKAAAITAMTNLRFHVDTDEDGHADDTGLHGPPSVVRRSIAPPRVKHFRARGKRVM